MRTAVCIVALLSSMGLAQDYSTQSSCADDQYQCQLGNCIPGRWVCDNYEDCPYGDDESNCYNTDNTETTELSSETTERPCRDNEYECWSGQCIPGYWVCDDFSDCYNGDDEYDCDSTTDYTSDITNGTLCPEDYYQCFYNGDCIPGYWVCDGMADCPVYGDDEQGCTTINSTTPPPQRECKNSFDYIYDRCVMVDPFTKTNWAEARYLCEKFNSDLVKLSDYNFYAELLQYINNKGLGNHSYWVGATDKEMEGDWRWIDYSYVDPAAPLWALYGCTGDYQLEPRPSDAENQDCGSLDKNRGLYMSDASCDESFATICQIYS